MRPAPASSCASAASPRWPTCRPWRTRPVRAEWCGSTSPPRRAAASSWSGSPGCRPIRPGASRPASTASACGATGNAPPPASGFRGCAAHGHGTTAGSQPGTARLPVCGLQVVEVEAIVTAGASAIAWVTALAGVSVRARFLRVEQLVDLQVDLVGIRDVVDDRPGLPAGFEGEGPVAEEPAPGGPAERQVLQG